VSGISHSPNTSRLREAKQQVRERVWALLEAERVARFPGARGRIPSFNGAEAAAALLATTPEWRRAAVVKSNPDQAQLPVRRQARRDGKLLYMAVPKLAGEQPFVVVRSDPTIKRALAEGAPVAVEDVEPLDLVVCGTVAVNRAGVRVGKGGGYADLEFALLVEAGLVSDDTVLATTVHPLQVLDEALPETEHDFRVDLVVTPKEVLRPPRARRPDGIVWEHLDTEKIASIPVLAALQAR
jgi:5-formyltetrahydrofolate cyclo-ligase